MITDVPVAGATDSPVAGATRTVERALSLLAEVCADQSLSLSECARRTHLPTSTALRLLRTLESADFVLRDEHGLFEPGPRLIQLGAAALGRHSLVVLALPALARVVEATGETAYISVRGPGSTALTVGMLEGTHAVRHSSGVGRTVALQGSAVGAALLEARLPGGFVAQPSSAEPDVTAIAAPIRRPGAVAAALSVVGPTYRLDARAVARFGPMVAREAALLSGQFGVGGIAGVGAGT